MDHSEVKHLPNTDYTPADLSEDSRVLLAAADIIDSEGLCKHRPYSATKERGPVCLLGGILRAITGSAGGWCHAHPEHSRVVRIARQVHPCMAEWNDKPERTKDEVVARMRAAALGL